MENSRRNTPVLACQNIIIIGALTVGSSSFPDSVDDIFFLHVYGNDFFLLTHGAYPTLINYRYTPDFVKCPVAAL